MIEWLKEWWTVIAIGALACGIALNFWLLIPALSRLSDQAHDGKLARHRQCTLYPVSTKLFIAAARYHLITQKDLDTYLASRPTGCPNPTPIP